MLMVFACGCGGGSKAPEDDRSDAIKPASGEEAVTLYDSTLDQTLTLTRVTTDSREDAKELLNVVYAYLESLGITAKIKSMYTIPFGLAGQYDDILPLKVFFEDENVAPIYIPVFHDGREWTKGLTAEGSFRDDDVTNSEYFNKTLAVDEAWKNKLKANLGFAKEDIQMYFAIAMTRDLSFSIPDENQKKLYEETVDRYTNYMLATWSNDLGEPKEIDAGFYQPLNRDDIKTRDDLGKYLGAVFTEENVTAIRQANPDLESGSYPIYYEYDGKLWVAPIGQGGPEDIGNIEVKYAAQKGDYLFLIIEVTRIDDRNWDTWEVLKSHYEEHIFVYEKSGSNWLCDYFEDIPFGYYYTMM